MLHFFLKIQPLRGVGKEWGVRLGSLGLFKRYTSFFPVTLKCAVLTFGTSKFCVEMSNPFQNCCFPPQKNFIGTCSILVFFLPKWNGYTSQYFWIPGFCATAICTKGLCHLEILQRIPVPAFLRNSLLFVNFFVRNWNLFVCFCRGAKAPYRQKQKKVSVPTKKLKKEQVPKKKLVQNPL